MPKDIPEMADGSVTVLKHEGVDKVHKLWYTPIAICKPFDDNFMKQLKQDIVSVSARAMTNSVDVWQLPNLPDTLNAVKAKQLEIAEQIFKEDAEMPLPALRIAKGYFRAIEPNMPYRITPHHHGSTLGAGIFYISVNNDNAGNLVVMDPRGGVNYNNQFSPFKRIRIEEGMMVVCPGYLMHFVEPTDYYKPIYDMERLMIVSNIHRIYEDFLVELEKNETYINSMGSFEL
jgi:hypothetical protein